ncbi:MAG: ankyrin repeat domain-containing protein [Desulfobulbus sp.]|nr:ankyrin repeat domain-containing protein [Desulfobulbus sp.]
MSKNRRTTKRARRVELSLWLLIFEPFFLIVPVAIDMNKSSDKMPESVTVQGCQNRVLMPGIGDQEPPLYARLGLEVGAAEWLHVALEQDWVQGSSPTVFISYCTKDERWRFQFERFLGPELARLSCPITMEPYRPMSFASIKQGTATGTQFTVELASQLWRCRTAVVLLSQDYINSPICAAIELPFLAWRHVAQGMPLYVIQVGVVSATASVIPLPQVNGRWPDFDLKKQTNDSFPGLDHRERKKVRQPNIFELRKAADRDRRLVAFSELLRSNLAEQHRRVAESKILPACELPTNRKTEDSPAPKRKTVGAFPPIDGFEGRTTERGLLAEVLTQPDVSVVALCQIGGAGKTCLALKTIEDLLVKQQPSHFEAVFQFTFYGGRSQDEFVHELGMFINDVLYECRPSEGIEAWMLEVLRRRAILLLLDGMEVIQSSSLNADVGMLQQGGVRTLLLWLCYQKGVRSAALVTSRLDLCDLIPFRGGHYLPIELSGLSLDDGVRLLQRKGVQAPTPVLRRVVAELSGHPLGLMVFANSVQRVKMVQTNAAVVVLRKTELLEPGSLNAKLRKLLAYYQKAIDETDKKLIASVAVFPDGAPVDWLRDMFVAGLAEGKLKQTETVAQLVDRLDRLAREGILQAVPTLSRTEYTAHPVIRESFRIAASGLVETAAQLHLSARPSYFVPKTILQAMPFVRAVEIYCENGNFAAAGKVMSDNLGDGCTLSDLGEYRILFNLLWLFVQPDRFEQSKAALGVERFKVFLSLASYVSIHLSEWEIAKELCVLGAEVLTPMQLAYHQAAIQQNIGSFAEAERLLRLGIAGASFLEKLMLEPRLADVLRRQGKLREAWRLLRDWIRYRPKRLNELVSWIQSWSVVSLYSAWLWSEVDASIAGRFLIAMDKAKADPRVPKIILDWDRAFLEWQQLHLVPRDRRTSDQWLRMLELARIMCDKAAQNSHKEADGGWMVVVLESLNGLQKHQNALDTVPEILAQLHDRSQLRPWVDIEASRAYLGLGQLHLAYELAGRAFKQALASRHVLKAREAATLLLELPNVLTPNASETLARQLLEASKNDLPSGKEFQLDVPLPGEIGWDSHLATLLAECVSEAPAEEKNAFHSFFESLATKLHEEKNTFDFALQFAAKWGISAAVPAILARGGRPLSEGSLDDNPLMLAVRYGHVEVVRALLDEFGALDLSDVVQGRIALAAIEECNLEIAELILSGASNRTQEWLSEALVKVASYGDERLFDLLLQHGADPAIGNSKGDLPIVEAAMCGNLAILHRLTNLTSISGAAANGKTALMAAVVHGQQRVIDLFAEMNAGTNQLDKELESVADAAAKSGAIKSLIHLAARFDLMIDLERHLLPAIKFAEHSGYDLELRFALTWLDSEAGRRINSPDLKPKVCAALKRLAEKHKLNANDVGLTSVKMNIGLMVNAQGKLCLVHDAPFGATPLWVGYHFNRRQIEISFDNGKTYPIDWVATDELHIYLMRVDKILIIRMEDKKPVEGYDTSFLKLKDGKPIDQMSIACYKPMPNQARSKLSIAAVCLLFGRLLFRCQRLVSKRRP